MSRDLKLYLPSSSQMEKQKRSYGKRTSEAPNSRLNLRRKTHEEFGKWLLGKTEILLWVQRSPSQVKGEGLKIGCHKV